MRYMRYSSLMTALVVVGCASSIHRDSGFTSSRVSNSAVFLAIPGDLDVAESDLFDQNWAETHGVAVDNAKSFFSEIFHIALNDFMVDGLLLQSAYQGSGYTGFEEIPIRTVEGSKDTLVRRGTWNAGESRWDSVWVSSSTANHVVYTYFRPEDDLVRDHDHDPDISITLSNLAFSSAVYKDGPFGSRSFTRTKREGFDWATLEFFCAWVELPLTARYLIWDHKNRLVLRAGNLTVTGTGTRGCEVSRDHWTSAIEALAREIVRGTPLHDNRIPQYHDPAEERARQHAHGKTTETLIREYLRGLQLEKQERDQER